MTIFMNDSGRRRLRTTTRHDYPAIDSTCASGRRLKALRSLMYYYDWKIRGVPKDPARHRERSASLPTSSGLGLYQKCWRMLNMPFQPVPQMWGRKCKSIDQRRASQHLVYNRVIHSPSTRCCQTCIGAKLKILLHPLSLNSLPTAPFSLDPIGSPPLFINTQALSSNPMLLPSGLETFFAHRTMTACLMSPLRTFCAAAIETEPPGPDSGPNDLCF